MGGVELLAELLSQAPGIKLLVTSRERLHLPEEWVFDVPGLSYPPREDLRLEEAEHYTAVRLFVERARRLRADFALRGEEAAVCEICRLVEGTPRGIELAAAWVRLLSPREIAYRSRWPWAMQSSR